MDWHNSGLTGADFEQGYITFSGDTLKGKTYTEIKTNSGDMCRTKDLIPVSTVVSVTLPGGYRWVPFQFDADKKWLGASGNNFDWFNSGNFVRLHQNCAYVGIGICKIGDSLTEAMSRELGDKIKIFTRGDADFGTLSDGTLYVKGRNLLSNTKFENRSQVTGWDTTKNGNYVASNWGGYNSGVPNASTCYHAHLIELDSGWTYDFHKETEGWLGINYALSSGAASKILKAGQTVTISAEVYRVSGSNLLTGGIFHYLVGGTSMDFYSTGGAPAFTGQMQTGKWVRMYLTFTLHKDFDHNKAFNLYFYGGTGSAGQFYLRRPMLNLGDEQYPFTMAPEERANPTEVV